MRVSGVLTGTSTNPLKWLMENKPARYASAGRPFAAAFAAAEERIRKMEYRYVSMLMHCPWRRAAELDRG